MANSHVRNNSLGFVSRLALGVVFVGVCAAQTESIPADSPRWQLEGDAKVADYLGRRSLCLQGGVATLRDSEIVDGVIDLDMAGSGACGFLQFIFSDKTKRRWRACLSAATQNRFGRRATIYVGVQRSVGLADLQRSWFHGTSGHSSKRALPFTLRLRLKLSANRNLGLGRGILTSGLPCAAEVHV